MIAKKHATPTIWVDPDDAPELTEAFFERANLYVGNKLIRRGCPKAVIPKALNFDSSKFKASAALAAAAPLGAEYQRTFRG